jgi:hypothetical protein
MRTLLSVASSFAALTIGPLSLAAPQNQASKPGIEQQIRAQYPITRVGANGTVLHAGTVLVIQVDGIRAIPASYQWYWSSTWKGGRARGNMIQNVPGGLPDASELRLLQVGEKAYLTNIETKDAEVLFSVQTCGACNPSSPDPNEPPFRARITFQLGKGYLTSGDFNHIQETIGQAFAIDTSAPPNPSPTPSVGGLPAPQTFEPIAPPPPPAAAPRKIEIGQTIEQVKASFGDPTNIVSLGDKVIYIYKNLKVTFVNGKVSDVE